MFTTMSIPNEPVFEKIIGWVKNLVQERQIGLISTPDGEEVVVMHPEQVAELEVILSDPAFLSAIHAGVADVSRGRLRRLDPGLTLSEAADGALPCDSHLAEAADQGVKDIIEGRMSVLRDGQTPTRPAIALRFRAG